MRHKRVKRKGDFEKVVVYIFLVLMGVTVMGYSAWKFIHFKVNVQKVGQEEYDRFTLTEKILNAKGCTVSRGIFLLDKVKNPNEKCQFRDCEIATTANWAYSLRSEDFETKICEIKGKEGETYKPEFKISEAIPVLLYDKEKDRYMTAHLLIYGPEGVYSTSYSSGRSYSTLKEFKEKKDWDDVKEAVYEVKFKCDAPSDIEPKAWCIIEKINSKIESFTGGGCNPCNLKAEIYIGDKKKDTETMKKGLRGFFNAWEEWSAENYFSEKIPGGENIKIGTRWVYHTGKKGKKYQVRDFRRPQMKINYRVVCPPGMIAKEVFKEEFKNKEKRKEKEIICESLEEKEGKNDHKE